jgi:raffinose/stachyose/melibiose transport system permease protein
MIPNIVPTAAIGVMFTLLLNPSLGVIKYLFNKLGLELSLVPNLFGNSKYAFWTVTITWIFYSAFNTIIFLAEMEAVDKTLYEAASIDGASPWQIDRYMVLPMLKNIIGTCVVLASIAMVSQFDIIYITTRGGPGTATVNLPIYLYKAASLENNYGKANSVGVVQIITGLGLIMLIRTIFNLKEKKKREEGLL